MAEMSIDLCVDESYLLALVDQEPIPISDEKFAIELQLQEALFNSHLFPSLGSKPEEEKQSNNPENGAFELGESSNSKLEEVVFNSSSFQSLRSKQEIIQSNNTENGVLELGESSNSKLQELLFNFSAFQSLGSKPEEEILNHNLENRVLEFGESSNSKFQESLFNSSSCQLLRSKPEEEKESNNPQKRAMELCESSNNKLIFCGICMELKQNPEIFEGLTKCYHSFCIDCIVKYIASKIREKIVPIECPDPNCNRVVEPGDCGSILPKEVFERWESALFEASVLGSQTFYCPFKDCSVLMVDDGEEQVTKSECPYCHRLFCAKCRVGWHEGVTCEELESLEKDEREKEDIVLMQLAKDKQWRRCSNCRFYVEKTEGCLHMTCRCCYEFCYKCGGKWSMEHSC